MYSAVLRLGRALVPSLAALVLAAAVPAQDEAPSGNPPSFDGDAAYRLVERQLEFGARVPGTDAHRAAASWFERYLRERADELRVQRFDHTTEDGKELELVNLWARFNPHSGTRPVLFLAHWDSRPISDRARDPEDRALPVPGANDGASGTAVLLELADMMKRRPPPRAVDLLLVDGEDYGDFGVGRDVLLGSRHFAAHRPEDYRPQYAVLLDLVGDRDLALYVERHSERLAPEVVQRVWGRAARLGLAHVFRRTARYAVEDDHVPLNEAGIPTAAVIDPVYTYWHTPEDTADKVSPASLAVVGRVVTSLIYDKD